MLHNTDDIGHRYHLAKAALEFLRRGDPLDTSRVQIQHCLRFLYKLGAYFVYCFKGRYFDVT